MSGPRDISVRLAVDPARPPGAEVTAVVIDVLRATTTMVYALAAGCACVRPCATVEEAVGLAASLDGENVLLGGERSGKPLPGFDLGNSPGEYTAARCRGATVVMTTTNGTRALLHAAGARRVLPAAFVNYGAACEQLRREGGPVCVVCAGEGGLPALEDALLAGALVDFLAGQGAVRLDDGARLAWDSYRQRRGDLAGALREGAGGARLRALGYDEDVRAAAAVDAVPLAAEVRREPFRVTAAG
jgi:2-phosphosulfolactate phosphatase